jgi:hypothetical protein
VDAAAGKRRDGTTIQQVRLISAWQAFLNLNTMLY